MSIRLGVNIDHVATLRNARGGIYPSPLNAAKIVKKSGANQVTVHTREDMRHITKKDVIEIINNVDIDVNLEIAPTDDMLDFAIKIKPNFICLVPERREELTTEGGLNLDQESVHKAINKLHKHNLNVCLFVEPNINIIKKCKELDIKYIELHTGKYANLDKNKQNIEVSSIRECAEYAKNQDINCHAGHGLDYDNVESIAKISEIKELNIGHSIVSMSIIEGLENSIKRMIKIINNCRND